MVSISAPVIPDVDEGLFRLLLAYKRKLTDRDISQLLRRTQPVVRRDGKLYFIRSVDPRNIAFAWDPQILNEATGLLEITRLYTLHTYGYQGLFKASIEEVLSMIPQHMLGRVKAFETIGPEDIHDLARQRVAVNDGYHVAVTILYG